jgi:citrate lyase subunit beta/citryl-CoA lyase
MTEIRPQRSVLYVPASNQRAVQKAASLACDSVILDLEDAIAPEDKHTARDALPEAVKGLSATAKEVLVRVNALDTPWFSDDAKAVSALDIHGVVVPKVQRGGDVKAYGRQVRKLPLWAMFETPAAVLFAADIAADEPGRLQGLIVGSNDLAKELRCSTAPGRTGLRLALQTAVAAARSQNLAVLDGVWNNIEDAAGFAAECEDGRTLGFDGKTLIHPTQIAGANKVFAPTEAELREARAIVEAFGAPEAEAKGAIKLNGKMVERLHLKEAQRRLALHEAIQERERGSPR